MLDIHNCNLCPRKCGIDRSISIGFCGSSDKIQIAKYMLHHWEEPCISGKRGSGAVFFSGCSLKCVYCQNYEISRGNKGDYLSPAELSDIFLELEEKGAHNINLVTPTHFVTEIIKALDISKHKLDIPIVYNCGGYENTEVLKALDGYVDVYIQDIKYSDNKLAKKLSGADDYFERAKEATVFMINQKGNLEFKNNGILKQGVIIRHLVLPGYKMNSYGVLDFIKLLDKNKYLLSLMSQFTPTKICEETNILNKKVTKKEYELIMNKALFCDIDNGYFQELDSASEDYIPDF